MASTAHLRLRRIHGFAGLFIGGFLVLHLTNHLAALGGVEAHITLMDLLRRIYRQPLLEALLLAAVALQVGLGLTFLWRARGRRHHPVARLQLLSGAYLAFFLLVHVGAVMVGRFSGLDTNFHFASAGYRQLLTALFFVPYYFLAVLALFTHLGCAAYWLLGSDKAPTARLALASMMLAGAAISMLISLCLAGVLIAFEVPANYLETYSNFR